MSLLVCVLMCFMGLMKVRQACISHTLNRTFCDGDDDVFYRFDESETGVYLTHFEHDILWWWCVLQVWWEWDRCVSHTQWAGHSGVWPPRSHSTLDWQRLCELHPQRLCRLGKPFRRFVLSNQVLFYPIFFHLLGIVTLTGVIILWLRSNCSLNLVQQIWKLIKLFLFQCYILLCWSVLISASDFFVVVVIARFHWPITDSQNALAWHRCYGLWKGCQRCFQAFHWPMELHQGLCCLLSKLPRMLLPECQELNNQL